MSSSKPFTVIIPARLASTRLPNKPLADIGGKPMIVRTAERAAQSGAVQVIVATDHAEILAVCAQHGIAARLTRSDHPSGTDRIAEVAAALGLAVDAVVVNVQGDEPMIDPALIAATAALINAEVPMATAAHAIDAVSEVFNPNVVKVVLNQAGRALYFSRATIPWHRDGFAQSQQSLPAGYQPLRHIGLYAYSNGFFANLSDADGVAAGTDRSAGAVASAVAWLPDCGAYRAGGAGSWRRYAGRPGAGARFFHGMIHCMKYLEISENYR